MSASARNKKIFSIWHRYKQIDGLVNSCYSDQTFDHQIWTTSRNFKKDIKNLFDIEHISSGTFLSKRKSIFFLIDDQNIVVGS